MSGIQVRFCDNCAPDEMRDYNGDIQDLGWNMPDVRETFVIETKCTENADDSYGPGCDDCDWCGVHNHGTVKIRINRNKSEECDCGQGRYWLATFDVLLNDVVVGNYPDQGAAADFVRVAFKGAKPPERDVAWEAERGLRIAEGWACN